MSLTYLDNTITVTVLKLKEVNLGQSKYRSFSLHILSIYILVLDIVPYCLLANVLGKSL